MVFNLKGQSTYFIVGILIALLSLVVLSGVYYQFSDSVDISNINEKLCKEKIDTLSIETKDEGIQDDTLNLLPNFLNPIEFLKSCPTQTVIIDPENLDCDQDVIDINPYNTQKNCIIDEILDLSRNCWQMNSEGTINGYNWACYTASIGSVDNKDPNEIIKSRLKSYFQCNSENSNSNCKELERNSFVSAQFSSIYNSISSSSINSNKENLKFCSKINSEYNNKKLVEINQNIISYDYELFNLLFEDITENNNYIILNDILNTSIEECSLNEFKENLKSSHKSNLDLIKLRDEQNEIIFQNYCQSLIDQNCDDKKRFELSLKLSNSFDERIYFEDIKRVSDVKMYNKYLSFSDMFRFNDLEVNNKLVLYNDDPILPSSAFQINYCDGLSSVSSGLIPMYMCGNKKHISISNELNNAGSRLSKDSTAASCPIFSSISLADKLTFDTGVGEAISEICESSSFI